MGGQFLTNGLPGLAGIADGLVASVMSGLDKLKFLRGNLENSQSCVQLRYGS